MLVTGLVGRVGLGGAGSLGLGDWRLGTTYGTGQGGASSWPTKMQRGKEQASKHLACYPMADPKARSKCSWLTGKRRRWVVCCGCCRCQPVGPFEVSLIPAVQNPAGGPGTAGSPSRLRFQVAGCMAPPASGGRQAIHSLATGDLVPSRELSIKHARGVSLQPLLAKAFDCSCPGTRAAST